jgi:carboxylate-amine ligase
MRKVGVEEELMLVDPATGELKALGRDVLRAHEDGPPQDAPVEEELFLHQIESQTPPTTDLAELAGHLRAGRRAMGEATRSAGAATVASGSAILVGAESQVTPKPRYRQIMAEYGELARSAIASAMHVHVDVADDDEGVRVLDGIAPWLPLLLALSANSPYAHGRDTGYASWRYQTWSRWPSHGTGQPFDDVATYRSVTEQLIEWGAGLDQGMVYFDARLARDYPTVEIRVADVCGDVEDAVLVAALSRGLVATSADQSPRSAVGPWRGDLLRAASWRASRYGLADQLVDPVDRRLVPARQAFESLVAHVRPTLEACGDVALVSGGIDRVFARGNGAMQQRRTFEKTGDLVAVVSDAVRRTEASWDGNG